MSSLRFLFLFLFLCVYSHAKIYLNTTNPSQKKDEEIYRENVEIPREIDSLLRQEDQKEEPQRDFFPGLKSEKQISAEKIWIVLPSDSLGAWWTVGFLSAIEEQELAAQNFVANGWSALVVSLWAHNYSSIEIEKILTQILEKKEKEKEFIAASWPYPALAFNLDENGLELEKGSAALSTEEWRKRVITFALASRQKEFIEVLSYVNGEWKNPTPKDLLEETLGRRSFIGNLQLSERFGPDSLEFRHRDLFEERKEVFWIEMVPRTQLTGRLKQNPLLNRVELSIPEYAKSQEERIRQGYAFGQRQVDYLIQLHRKLGLEWRGKKREAPLRNRVGELQLSSDARMQKNLWGRLDIENMDSLYYDFKDWSVAIDSLASQNLLNKVSYSFSEDSVNHQLNMEGESQNGGKLNFLVGGSYLSKWGALGGFGIAGAYSGQFGMLGNLKTLIGEYHKGVDFEIAFYGVASPFAALKAKGEFYNSDFSELKKSWALLLSKQQLRKITAGGLYQRNNFSSEHTLTFDQSKYLSTDTLWVDSIPILKTYQGINGVIYKGDYFWGQKGDLMTPGTFSIGGDAGLRAIALQSLSEKGAPLNLSTGLKMTGVFPFFDGFFAGLELEWAQEMSASALLKGRLENPEDFDGGLFWESDSALNKIFARRTYHSVRSDLSIEMGDRVYGFNRTAFSAGFARGPWLFGFIWHFLQPYKEVLSLDKDRIHITELLGQYTYRSFCVKLWGENKEFSHRSGSWNYGIQLGSGLF